MFATRSAPIAAAIALLLVFGASPALADDAEPNLCDPALLPVPEQLVAGLTDQGEVRIDWAAVPPDPCLTGFRIHLSLNNVAEQGEQVFSVPAEQSTALLDSTLLRALGAPVGSGRHFSLRVQGISGEAGGPRSAKVTTMAGQPTSAPEAGAARVTIAAYNLAFTPELSRRTLAARRSPVARQIVGSGASVIALSESVQIRGASNTQLGTLMDKIRAVQRKSGKSASWRFTRSTRYAVPGKLVGGDGTRILYNRHRVNLLSSCTDVTKVKKTVVKKVKRHGKVKRIKRKKTIRSPYSRSCTIKLPRIGGNIYQRWAPIARFQDRKTGQRFWFVSAHLEVRKGPEFDQNRSVQLRKIVSELNRLNTRHEPVIIAGDLNLSTRRTPDLATLNTRLVGAGFADAVTAPIARNLAYPTYNGWKAQTAIGSGYASRLDHIFASGGTHVAEYTNVVSSASDHNLISATAWLK